MRRYKKNVCIYTKRIGEEMWDLEFSGKHGDGNTSKDDTKHSNSSVAFPMKGTTIGPTRHTPYFCSKVTSSACSISAHLRF